MRIGKSRGQEENSRKARQQAPERIIVCIDENGVIYLCSGDIVSDEKDVLKGKNASDLD